MTVKKIYEEIAELTRCAERIVVSGLTNIARRQKVENLRRLALKDGNFAKVKQADHIINTYFK